MCVCVCVCVCVCTCPRAYKHACMCMHVCACEHVCACMWACLCAHWYWAERIILILYVLYNNLQVLAFRLGLLVSFVRRAPQWSLMMARRSSKGRWLSWEISHKFSLVEEQSEGGRWNMPCLSWIWRYPANVQCIVESKINIWNESTTKYGIICPSPQEGSAKSSREMPDAIANCKVILLDLRWMSLS